MKQYLLSALVIAALVIAAGCSGDAKVETEPADITFSGGGDAISFMWDDDNDDAQNHPRSGPGVDIQIVYDNQISGDNWKKVVNIDGGYFMVVESKRIVVDRGCFVICLDGDDAWRAATVDDCGFGREEE